MLALGSNPKGNSKEIVMPTIVSSALQGPKENETGRKTKERAADRIGIKKPRPGIGRGEGLVMGEPGRKLGKKSEG